MPKDEKKTPTQVFSENLRHAMQRLRLTDGDVARKLEEMNYPLDRRTIGRLRDGSIAKANLDDAFAIIAALGVQPTTLLALGYAHQNDQVMALGNVELDGRQSRQWLRSQLSLREQDNRTWLTEVPDVEWVAFEQHRVNWLLGAVRDFVVAAEDNDKNRVLAAIERINAELDRQKEDVALRTERGGKRR